MDQWEPHLHWQFKEEHVLFRSIVLHSFPSFLLASLLLILLCLTERVLTFYHDKIPLTEITRKSRWRMALWRCVVYWLAIILRLCYMLAAMSFNIGLILVIATALASTQLILDLRKVPRPQAIPLTHISAGNDSEPLLPSNGSVTALSSAQSRTRPRSKSKPDDIFIHPAQSNIARADAMAVQLGLAGNTERVHVNLYEGKETAWELGKGKDLARELLASTAKIHQKSSSFQLGSNSDSDDDDDDSVTKRLIQ